jgi:hypothetical protein
MVLTPKYEKILRLHKKTAMKKTPRPRRLCMYLVLSPNCEFHFPLQIAFFYCKSVKMTKGSTFRVECFNLFFFTRSDVSLWFHHGNSLEEAIGGRWKLCCLVVLCRTLAHKASAPVSFLRPMVAFVVKYETNDDSLLPSGPVVDPDEKRAPCTISV